MSDEATTTGDQVMSDCAQTLRELDVFLDGELSDHQRAAIHHHLDGCMDCLGAFDFHAELKIVVAQKCNNDEMPPGLLGKIERCFGTDFDRDGHTG
jgi:mycothiol system anti-sigma-R factor